MNWAGKRVLLTGHTGFKGSWLSLWLQEKGAALCGVALEVLDYVAQTVIEFAAQPQ